MRDVLAQLGLNVPRKRKADPRCNHLASRHGTGTMSDMSDMSGRRAALGRTELLRDLPPADLDAVVARAGVRRIGRGKMILHRGDPSVGIFVITSGRVRISLVSEEGREVTLSILGPCEVLGEMSLLDGGECSADATVLEDCVLLVVERSHFMRLLRGNNALCLQLLSILSRLLLRLAKDYGAANGRGTRIELKLSQKDLSTLVGGSREKVNRRLREWEEDGVLGKDGSRIVVLKPKELASEEWCRAAGIASQFPPTGAQL
jgi:CRP/FNR family transcriptional regulator, cyclic AMP receptor protein